MKFTLAAFTTLAVLGGSAFAAPAQEPRGTTPYTPRIVWCGNHESGIDEYACAGGPCTARNGNKVQMYCPTGRDDRIYDLYLNDENDYKAGGNLYKAGHGEDGGVSCPFDTNPFNPRRMLRCHE